MKNMTKDNRCECSSSSELHNMVITPSQARRPSYRLALRREIQASALVTPADLKKIRINHPEILDYKARLLGGESKAVQYEDWTEFLLRDVGRANRCLSLGSGIGRIESYLISRGFTDSFETIELSPHANRVAKTMDSRILATEGDLNFVMLDEERYDFILCHSILHHLINIEHVLHQVNKALLPGGLVLIYEYVGESHWQFDSSKMSLLQREFPGVKFRVPAEWEVGGFESIRSAGLLDIIGAQFGKIAERRADYGSVYFPFVICTPPSADREMKRVIELDLGAQAEGLLPPSYHCGLYRKTDREPMQARPWSNEELDARATPPAPLGFRLHSWAKQTRLGLSARQIKRKVGEALVPAT